MFRLHLCVPVILYSLVIFFLLIPFQGFGQEDFTLNHQLKGFESDSQKVDFLLKQINDVYVAAPAQALKLADMADSLLQSMDAPHEKLEAARLRALAYREQGLYDKAIQVLENPPVQKPSVQSNSRLVSLWAKLNITLASLYRRKGDVQQALGLNIKAARAFDSLVMNHPNDDEFLAGQATALSGLGMIHATLNNLETSNSYFIKALQVNQKIKNQEQITFTLFNLGSNFFKNKQYDSAELYWQKGVEFIDTVYQATLLQAFYYNLGALKVTEKKWDDAASYYRKALQLVQKTGNQEEIARSYESLANLYIEKGDYEKAEKEAKMALSLVKDGLDTKVRIHEDLAVIYENTGRLPKAIHYYKQAAILQDSLSNAEKNQAIAEMEAKYQHEKQQQELRLQQQQIELLSQENQIKSLTRNILALVVLLLLISGYFLLKAKNSKVKRKHEQLKHSQAMLTYQEENSKLRELRLQEELSHRNQQLTSYTLNFIQKNELLEILKEQIDSLQKQKQWTAHDFRPIKQKIQQSLSIDQDWENFKLHFEHVHPDFFNKLIEIYPDLSPSELKLCALIRLKMNIKETALVLGISPDSVKTARYRLRKKMLLDPDANILDVLMQIEKGVVLAVSEIAVSD